MAYVSSGERLCVKYLIVRTTQEAKFFVHTPTSVIHIYEIKPFSKALGKYELIQFLTRFCNGKHWSFFLI